MQEINRKLFNIFCAKHKDIKIEYRVNNQQYVIMEWSVTENFNFTMTTNFTDIQYLAYGGSKELAYNHIYNIYPINLYLLSRLFI